MSCWVVLTPSWTFPKMFKLREICGFVSFGLIVDGVLSLLPPSIAAKTSRKAGKHQTIHHQTPSFISVKMERREITYCLLAYERKKVYFGISTETQMRAHLRCLSTCLCLSLCLSASLKGIELLIKSRLLFPLPLRLCVYFFKATSMSSLASCRVCGAAHFVFSMLDPFCLWQRWDSIFLPRNIIMICTHAVMLSVIGNMVIMYSRLNPGSNNGGFGPNGQFLIGLLYTLVFFLFVSTLTDKGLTGAWDWWEALQSEPLSFGSLFLWNVRYLKQVHDS